MWQAMVPKARPTSQTALVHLAHQRLDHVRTGGGGVVQVVAQPAHQRVPHGTAHQVQHVAGVCERPQPAGGPSVRPTARRRARRCCTCGQAGHNRVLYRPAPRLRVLPVRRRRPPYDGTVIGTSHGRRRVLALLLSAGGSRRLAEPRQPRARARGHAAGELHRHLADHVRHEGDRQGHAAGHGHQHRRRPRLRRAGTPVELPGPDPRPDHAAAGRCQLDRLGRAADDRRQPLRRDHQLNGRLRPRCQPAGHAPGDPRRARCRHQERCVRVRGRRDRLHRIRRQLRDRRPAAHLHPDPRQGAGAGHLDRAAERHPDQAGRQPVPQRRPHPRAQRTAGEPAQRRRPARDGLADRSGPARRGAGHVRRLPGGRRRPGPAGHRPGGRDGLAGQVRGARPARRRTHAVREPRRQRRPDRGRPGPGAPRRDCDRRRQRSRGPAPGGRSRRAHPAHGHLRLPRRFRRRGDHRHQHRRRRRAPVRHG